MRGFNSQARPPKAARAFSLLEMLVACAVLAVLVALIGQIISMTSRSIAASKNKLECVAEMRMALDRIGMDLAARVRRSDIPSSFLKASLNDSFAFYSEVDSCDGTRRISAVSYRINSTAYQMERAAVATNWTGTSTLNFSGTSGTMPSVTDTDYDALAPNILRLEICFLKTDGSVSNSAKTDLSDVTAFIVAVAALDASNRKTLSTNQLKTLASALDDSQEGKMPATVWQTDLNQSNFAPGVPRQAAYSVRFFQRSFSIR